MISDLGFQHLLPAFFIAQEKDVKETRGVNGGIMLPPNRDDEGRVV